MGTPFKRGGRYFQFRNTGLQNQDVLYWASACAMTDLAAAEWHVLLDPNTLSEEEILRLRSG